MVKYLILIILVVAVWNIYKKLGQPQSNNGKKEGPGKKHDPFKDHDVSDGEFREVK